MTASLKTVNATLRANRCTASLSAKSSSMCVVLSVSTFLCFFVAVLSAFSASYVACCFFRFSVDVFGVTCTGFFGTRQGSVCRAECLATVARMANVSSPRVFTCVESIGQHARASRSEALGALQVGRTDARAADEHTTGQTRRPLSVTITSTGCYDRSLCVAYNSHVVLAVVIRLGLCSRCLGQCRMYLWLGSRSTLRTQDRTYAGRWSCQMSWRYWIHSRQRKSCTTSTCWNSLKKACGRSVRCQRCRKFRSSKEKSSR